MRYLFDTQALVFYLEGDSKLPSEMRDFIEDYENQGYVSVITLHELVLKTANNQLELSSSLAQIVLYLKEAGVEILPLNHHHIIRLDSFERESYHKDPFDRLLVAQCIEENITMLTSDTKIPLYKNTGWSTCNTNWIDSQAFGTVYTVFFLFSPKGLNIGNFGVLHNCCTSCPSGFKTA